MKYLSFLYIVIMIAGCVPQTIAFEDYPRSSTSKAYQTPRVTSKKLQVSKHYTIKNGDSLWKIAQMYGVTIKELANENKISLTANLKIGQKLSIPDKRIVNAPFIWPVNGEAVSLFEETIDGIVNKGLNIKTAPQEPVRAAGEGRVVYASSLKGLGQTLILKHSDNFYTIYSNLSKMIKKEGTCVAKGEEIAWVNPGSDNSDCVLHFEIRKNYLPMNPFLYLK